MATTFCDEKRPNTLILIAEDGDYFETLLEAVKRKWKVEVWFWSGILNCFNNHEPTKLCKKHLFPIIVSDDLKLSFPTAGASDKIKYEAKIHYTQLETCYKFFIYINGNPYNGMESLEITSCTMIENREIMEWLANLNLFSWINRENDSIFLYFSNKAELQIAKEWIMKELKEIVIWEDGTEKKAKSILPT
ncbi:15077_t:CDS:2 [Funneliformis geosporum]|nr:15077_t:CDS:2 [Funneliformis geosporum]